VKTRVVHVVGARPNFMKIAPVVQALAAYPDEFEQLLVHTGQHYDHSMSGAFFGELGLPEPDVNLDVGSGSHAEQTAAIMVRFEQVLLDVRPDWVLVPGDVNSTIAAALVAAKLGVRVAHLEAGLRSFDMSMPEEVNRVLTDRLADLLLTPSRDADENLLLEGVDPTRICFVGNVMIDTLQRLLPLATERWPRLRAELGLGSDQFVAVTLHRPVNVDEPAAFAEVARALDVLAESTDVVFPVHPRTQARCDALAKRSPRLRLVPPLGYLDFVALEAHAALVLTDSGGVQEETTYLGTPCLTVRETTERPITVTEGTNRLVSLDAGAIVSVARATLAAPRPATAPPDLWDGRAALRVADVLRTLGRTRSAPSQLARAV
jgi:UDP-N-acetylglucosamine 2-epimerase (non-hydrolysing)